MERFERHWIPEPNSGCWLWLGACNEHGYGVIRRNGKMIKAHRFSYENAKGPILEGREIDHLCRNKSCVNPDHLEAVTHGENRRRVPRDLVFSCAECGNEVLRKHRSKNSVRCKRCIHRSAMAEYEKKNEGHKSLYYLKNRETLLMKARERYQRSKGG